MTSETELQNARDAKELKILDLFDGWPGAKPTADNLRAFLAEVEEFSIEAVTRSVKQFRSAMVPRNNSFLPTVPEFVANVREWQTVLDRVAVPAVELHNGLLESDWGQGRVNLRGLTEAEQNVIIANKGKAPDGRSLAYLPLDSIREALGGIQIEGKARVVVPVVRGME